jgi:hypothetical protein
MIGKGFGFGSSGAGGGSTGLSFATLHVTSAQLLSLFTTSLMIIPAPGANNSICFVSGFCRYNFVTTAYSSTGLLLLFNTTLGASNGTSQAGISNAGIITSTTTRTVKWQGSGTAIGTTVNQMVPNDSLSVGLSVANPTLGDGTLDLFILYQIISTP